MSPPPARWHSARAHLLLLTGDKEYGDTSLPSSGLERLLLREYWGQDTALSGFYGLRFPEHPKANTDQTEQVLWPPFPPCLAGHWLAPSSP